MRRRRLLSALGAAAAGPLSGRAQQPDRVRTILWVSTEAEPDPFIDGFREGMRRLGYVEGRDLVLVPRYAPGDPAALRAMLPELLAVPADLIVSSGPAIRAMRAATGRPVLFAVSGDPVALGVVDSLSHPGRNFTGTTFLSLDLARKRVQLLRELVPGLRSLAALSNADHPGEPAEHEATREAAGALSLGLAYAPFDAPGGIEDALGRVRASGTGALLVYPDAVTMVYRARIAGFAREQGLPSMFGWREYCEAGGLASYGANQRAVYARLAAYADRILRGERPADLPVEQPSRFELVINLRTARALGLEVPSALLARADDLIE
ncbi:MAG TPA: ABC transporter substrate-binding protein [Crenalkalicoccus sp.]|jgi:putative ABC transport system substrate-binding protein|nr:ABC transporter substrate-binding protein [Crenalkalicoccus sp.]